MEYGGELAAIGAALAFSLTSTMFTLAGRNYTPVLVMRSSLPIGWVLLALINLALTGVLFPQAGIERWLWFGVSGIIGFWLGSLAIVNAFLRIGPRLTLLVAASAPIFSTIMGFLFLDQTLSPDSLLGIGFTLGGIAFVVTGRRGSTGTLPIQGSFRSGVVFAGMAAFGQASSFVLITLGLGADDPVTGASFLAPMSALVHENIASLMSGVPYFHPITGSLFRLTVGTAALWAVTILSGRARRSLAAIVSHPDSMRFMLVGAVAGPVAGASFVVMSLELIPVGISSTLANLTPIFLIPISMIVFKEQVSSRAILGTLIAMIGVAIIFL